eukprot:1326952-Amphidinium_carterae.1
MKAADGLPVCYYEGNTTETVADGVDFGVGEEMNDTFKLQRWSKRHTSNEGPSYRFSCVSSQLVDWNWLDDFSVQMQRCLLGHVNVAE